jgi:hypothetical protein
MEQQPPQNTHHGEHGGHEEDPSVFSVFSVVKILALPDQNSFFYASFATVVSSMV